jgi:hypothetical protein
MRSEVLRCKMLVFWVVTSCKLVGRHQRFGGICRLYFHSYATLHLKLLLLLLLLWDGIAKGAPYTAIITDVLLPHLSSNNS